MSTYLTKRKGTRLTGWVSYCVTYCVLSGLIAVLLTLFLSPVASAAKKDDMLHKEYLARTGVSVVRIVATYGLQKSGSSSIPLTPTATSTKPKSNVDVPPITCTGLGVIVAGVGQTVWVVTDGSLVSTSGLTCKQMGPTHIVDKQLQLNTLNVYVNDAYNSTASRTMLSGDIKSVHCNAPENCSDGASLFSFQSTRVLPAIQLPDATSTTSTDTAIIQLSQSLTNTAIPTTIINVQQYLMPTASLITGTTGETASITNDLEGGTPIVDPQGFINGIYLKDTAQQPKIFKAIGITTLLKEGQGILSDSTANNVSTHWNSGISEYYQGSSSYGKANSDFKQAYSASNNQFQGAQQFIQATNPGGTSPGADETPNGLRLPGGISVPYWLLAVVIVGVIALLLLLFLLNSLFRSARRHKDFVEADKQATIQAQQIQEMEAQKASVQSAASMVQQPVQQVVPHPVQQGANDIVNVPTLVPLSTAPVAPAQPTAIADYPTIDMSEVKHDGMLNMDKTQPLPPSLEDTVTSLQSTVKGGEEHVGFEVITSTDPGIKRKYKPNEDSLFAVRGIRSVTGHMQPIGLFVVADGMGGHANGQDASRLAIQTIIDYVLPRLVHGEDTRETAEKLLVDSVQLANQAVHQHNLENNADMGTTVTATLVVDATAYVANVGDSRTYLYSTSNGLVKVTRDHSVVASLVDAGIIKPDDIYTHPKRNQIYRSLGEKPFVEVDPFTVQLQPGDKLLLCSDGLWDMVRDPELQRVLETPVPEPQQLGDDLIQAALNGGGEDNVSVIVINVVDRVPKQPKPGLEIIYVQDNIKMPPLSK